MRSDFQLKAAAQALDVATHVLSAVSERRRRQAAGSTAALHSIRPKRRVEMERL